MATRTDVVQVSGIRCERCVGRLTVALRDQDGLESAVANLMGRVELAYDDEQTSRETLLAAMARAGFHEAPPV
ncbi:MAG TPA: heavy-metal-associated domain-containing protein [Gaiella sp.]|jgi:copper chaperone CopZ